MLRNFSSFKGFRNSLEVVHYIEGRMRLHAPSVNKWELVVEVKEFLESKANLQIQSNPVSKSLLVLFDSKTQEPYEVFFLILRALEKIGAIPTSKTSAFQKQFVLGSQLLNHGIYEQTQGKLDLWGLMPLLYLAFCVKSLLKGGGMRQLTLLTILWQVWSFWFSNQKNP